MTTAFTESPQVADTSWRRVVLIAVAGAVINVAIAAFGSAVLEMTFSMPEGAPNATIPLPMFALFTIIPVLIGTAIARFLARYGRTAVTAFIGIGAAIAVLSIALPFTLPVTTDTALLMVGTHLVAAGTFIAASWSTRTLAA